MRRMAAIAAIVGTSIVLTACSGTSSAPEEGAEQENVSGPEQELIDAAKEEGKVVFYSVEPDALNNAIGQKFTEKYGIPVEFLRLTSTDLTERFSAEQSSQVYSADLIQLVGSPIWEDDADWFVDLESAKLANWDDYPEQARHERCVDLRYSVGGVTYNNQLVDEEHVPTSYEDFLDPWWKGKLLLTDPRGTPAYMGWAAMVEDKYGIEFLEKLSEQDFTLVDSATPGAEKLAAGAAYANFGAHLSNSTAIRNEGAPLDFVVMSDVPTGLATCMGIVAKAPHPNAAKLFAQWSLTKEAQNASCEVFEAANVIEGTDCIQLPEGWKPTTLEVMSDPDRQERILEALGIE